MAENKIHCVYITYGTLWNSELEVYKEKDFFF